MRQGEQDVTVDPLFVGLTRPATILGVPYEAFVVEFVIVTVIFLGVGDPFYMLLMAPTHGVLYLISSQNPGVFGSFFIWTKTIGRCKNKNFWGGAASFSPLTSTKWIK